MLSKLRGSKLLKSYFLPVSMMLEGRNYYWSDWGLSVVAS